MVKNRGITLIEILAVIGIIVILAAVVTPVSLSIMKKAYIKKAQAMITQLEGALALYYNDWGYYPATVTAATQYNRNAKTAVTDNLVGALTQTTKNGPYITLKKEDLDSSGKVILDPWGVAYVYIARKYVGAGGTLTNVSTSYGPFWPNTNDPTRNTYNIYSFGPDGKTNGGLAGNDSGYYATTYFNEPADGNNDKNGAYTGDTNNDDDINNWSQQE